MANWAITHKQGKGEKKETKDWLSCLWQIFVTLDHGYKMTLTKSHIFVLTSRAQHESKDLYWRSTLQLLQEKKRITLKSPFSPAPVLPFHLLSLITHFLPVWARISAGVNLSKSEFTAGIRVCRVVYPHFRKCFPVSPRPESRLLQPEMHCSVVIFLFQMQKWVLSCTTGAELHLLLQWSTTL